MLTYDYDERICIKTGIQGTNETIWLFRCFLNYDCSVNRVFLSCLLIPPSAGQVEVPDLRSVGFLAIFSCPRSKPSLTTTRCGKLLFYLNFYSLISILLLFLPMVLNYRRHCAQFPLGYLTTTKRYKAY